MKNHIRHLSIVLALFGLISLWSCETTSEQDRATNMDANTPANSENTDMNTGNAAGSAGNNNDTSAGGSAVYEPGPETENPNMQGNTTGNKNEDSKANGVRETNEYPSGRAGGQYTNPKATTTPSGTNTNENPGTGTPGKTGSSGK